ncbi:MAG: hypothetical protein HUU22_11635 [Phycisphaerae bacterium]|nr:hypothetical protein [Phycisphaerae bacterium]NUQ46673.1 hypothetical protein [Phycisphaerae bacterium]
MTHANKPARSPLRRSTAWRYAAAALLILCLPLGCRDPRRKQPPRDPAVAGESLNRQEPAELVRALLEACRVLEQVGREGMKSPEAQAQFEEAEATLMAVADRNGVDEEYARVYGAARSDRARRRRVDGVIRSWPSVVARYISGVTSELPQPSIIQPHDYRLGIARNAHRVYRIVAREPEAEAALAEIRREAATTRNVRGELLRPGGDEYELWVRRRALERGLSPQPGALILVALRETTAGWGIVSVSLGPLDESQPLAQGEEQRE